MSEKSFDCVEMKRQGAERVLRRLANMSPEQELDYWRKGTERLREIQARAMGQREAAPPPSSAPSRTNSF